LQRELFKFREVVFKRGALEYLIRAEGKNQRVLLIKHWVLPLSQTTRG
jgi:hypothetical protein